MEDKKAFQGGGNDQLCQKLLRRHVRSDYWISGFNSVENNLVSLTREVSVEQWSKKALALGTMEPEIKAFKLN